jgi:chaperone BCS1
MSDQSFDEVVVPPCVAPGAPAAVPQPFESEAFDPDAVRKRYDIDPEQHVWAEVRRDEALYGLLTMYLARHGEKQRSFAPKISVKKLSTVEEMLGDEEPAKMVNMRCGLGLTRLQHTLDDGSLVAVKALHQRRGPIVGGRNGAETWENMVVFVEGSESGDRLKAFLETVVNSEAEASSSEYSVYRWQVDCEYWRHAATKTSRSMDSVVLPSHQKEAIVDDLNSFLSKETFRFYTNHGIPYKRSYLFYGVPGAGKTSLLTAIAGKYRRNLCIMQPTHPKMTDDSLSEAIKEAPSRSIIVLEDVDALFEGRESKNGKTNVSFSGLLNALDGIGNPDGQIFVLTTNFRENLDSALIRNGRVDMHVEFTNATPEQMEKLFLQFYPTPADAHLAGKFRESVLKALGDKPVNMAALQHFFIKQMRKTAAEAIDAVPAILDDLKEKAVAPKPSDEPARTGSREEGSASKTDVDGDGGRCGASSSVAAGQPASSSNVVHVHVYNAAQTPAKDAT